MSWQILFYETPSGQPLLEDFIARLQAVTKAKLVRQIDLLEEFGPQLTMPHAKPLGDGLYELRIRGKQEVRVFYIFTRGRHIYMLHGFLKKRQATPKRELDLARQRQSEIKKLMA